MPIELSWYIPNRVIYVQYIGNITVEEVLATNSQQLEMYKQGEPPVHVIVDLSQMDQFPTSINAIKDSLPMLKHPAMGWLTVCHIPSRTVQLMGAVISQLFRTRYQALPTKQHCIDFLHDIDDTL